jgi:hypothetical protein
LICADLAPGSLPEKDALSPLPGVALALTFLVSDAHAATCLTAKRTLRHPAKRTLRHPAVLSAAAHAALLPGTPRRTGGPPGAAHGAARKARSQANDPVSVSAYLCNFLDDRGIKPAKVLKKAGVLHETSADWHSGDAVNALYKAALPLMPQALYSDSEAASDSAASLVESDSD